MKIPIFVKQKLIESQELCSLDENEIKKIQKSCLVSKNSIITTPLQESTKQLQQFISKQKLFTEV